MENHQLSGRLGSRPLRQARMPDATTPLRIANCIGGGTLLISPRNQSAGELIKTDIS
jgi:hypothetical protein